MTMFDFETLYSLISKHRRPNWACLPGRDYYQFTLSQPRDNGDKQFDNISIDKNGLNFSYDIKTDKQHARITFHYIETQYAWSYPEVKYYGNKPKGIWEDRDGWLFETSKFHLSKENLYKQLYYGAFTPATVSFKPTVSIKDDGTLTYDYIRIVTSTTV